MFTCLELGGDPGDFGDRPGAEPTGSGGGLLLLSAVLTAGLSQDGVAAGEGPARVALLL